MDGAGGIKSKGEGERLGPEHRGWQCDMKALASCAKRACCAMLCGMLPGVGREDPAADDKLWWDLRDAMFDMRVQIDASAIGHSTGDCAKSLGCRRKNSAGSLGKSTQDATNRDLRDLNKRLNSCVTRCVSVGSNSRLLATSTIATMHNTVRSFGFVNPNSKERLTTQSSFAASGWSERKTSQSTADKYLKKNEVRLQHSTSADGRDLRRASVRCHFGSQRRSQRPPMFL